MTDDWGRAPKKLMSLGEAAKYVGWGINVFRKWVDQGHVAYIKPPGGHRVFLRDDLDAFLKAHHVEAIPAAEKAQPVHVQPFQPTARSAARARNKRDRLG